MEAFEIRRSNLMKVILERFEGNKAAFSRAAGVHPNHVNLLTTHNESIRRNLGEELCRRIEAAIDVPKGWMDSPHGSDILTVVIKSPPVNESISRILVQCKDVKMIELSKMVESKLTTKTSNSFEMFLATVVTHECEPLINFGDTVIIDTAVKAVGQDGLYVFLKNDHAFIRQVRATSDGKQLVCINPDYRSDKPEILKGTKVIAMVVGVVGVKTL